MNRTNQLIALLCVIALSSCTSKKPEKKPIIYPNESPTVTTTKANPTSVTAKQVASEQGSDLVVELKFQKSKNIIPAADQQRIKTLYGKAVKKGKIKEVQLITWADKDYPSAVKDELAEKQQNLVDKRNDGLEKYILKLDDNLSVKKISMAERAGALAKFTATEEAEVKESLDVRDAPGKAGHAMVIFILEN